MDPETTLSCMKTVPVSLAAAEQRRELKIPKKCPMSTVREWSMSFNICICRHIESYIYIYNFCSYIFTIRIYTYIFVFLIDAKNNAIPLNWVEGCFFSWRGVPYIYYS